MSKVNDSEALDQMRRRERALGYGPADVDREWSRSSSRFSLMVWLGAAIIIAAGVAAANFSKASGETAQQYYPFSSGVAVFTDMASGCQYLIFNNRGATPRLGADGTPLCLPMKHREATR
ncbi:hypothetical protein [Hyphomicrobium sp. 802]|uniref:hypothetical protein n=1 Tax=Hyphomicrobium sp. 802 TaxID=1112272 RepID=UPI00045E87FD|nr:hypothetical protein [Hyphomicrobium sp. 802]